MNWSKFNNPHNKRNKYISGAQRLILAETPEDLKGEALSNHLAEALTSEEVTNKGQVGHDKACDCKDCK